jgi:crotonobetainyl-CoA:carnitine CoA-transferase CaiB-like acyl-CoA transferase
MELASHTAGPSATMHLADQGAEVIKIEPRLVGDRNRTASTNAYLGLNSVSFMAMNRNKKSMTLDIRRPEAKDVLHRLVKVSDILVHNFRPAVAERLGVGYETMSELNPAIIYANLTAFGLKGPYAHQGGYDRIIQGVAGVMSWSPDGTPRPMGVYAADATLPMLMAYGIALALLVRGKTGRGQQVESSLLQTYIALQGPQLSRADDDPTPVEAESGREGGPHGIYRCADGKFINVAPNEDRQFVRLCEAMGFDDLAHDPRVTDPYAKGEFRRREVIPAVRQKFATGSRDEWLGVLQGADVPCGPILLRSQVIDEPQVVENEMMASVVHPVVGRTRIPAVPIHLSESPGSIRSAAPGLGEHTDEVLEMLGYSAAERDAFRMKEVT